jgi:transposase
MKETVVSVADAGSRRPPVEYGRIPSTPSAFRKLVSKLEDPGHSLSFCYEAGPCGYGVYRQLQGLGHSCTVVAPSLIPRKPGDRIKTDRRDASSLARLHRSGDLTPVWAPDEDQEAVRDLVRCREDAKRAQQQARLRLGSFLLRRGCIYPGRSKWTQAHRRWLESLRFTHPAQQIVFHEYADAVDTCTTRVAALEEEMHRALESWSLEPVVRAYMALRGINFITAMTLAAELGDLTRFDSPRQLMAFVGLVPSESSSGDTQRRGCITKTGNGHVRRVLVESAWCYRYQARKSAHLQRRAERTTPQVQAIAWKAQRRLCGRYRRLIARSKPKGKVCAAIARELIGFIWAIAWEMDTRTQTV